MKLVAEQAKWGGVFTRSGENANAHRLGRQVRIAVTRQAMSATKVRFPALISYSELRGNVA